MAAYLRWMALEERVPRRKIRDRLNPMEFYENSEFSQRYRFTKESVICLNGKVGPAIKHQSERNFAVPPLQQLLIALRFYATGCFQPVACFFNQRNNRESIWCVEAEISMYKRGTPHKSGHYPGRHHCSSCAV